MFIYLVAIVAIICSIFGLIYSQTSLRIIRDGGARLSTIQLPAFLHSTSLIEHSQAGVNGDNGIAERSSQQSLEISSEGMEEANRAEGTDEDNLKDNHHQLERRIFDKKFRDANQLGFEESLWSSASQNDSDKAMKDIINQKYASDGSKPAPQKINTIFNMIQYETFKEAMAVLQKQQEEEEAAKAAAANGKSTENDEQTIPDEEQKENIPMCKKDN